MLTAADVVRRAGSLATIPTVYLRLVNASGDPRRSMTEVGRIIEEDAAISARLLRLANSALFRRGEHVEDVPRALRSVGIAAALDLALATSVISAFAVRLPSVITPREFWLHAVACGVAARAVATRAGLSGERHFTAGVLHDVGRLLLLLVEPETMKRAMAEAARERVPLRDAETAVLGFDHAALGAELLRTWGLPETLVVAAGGHHAPGSATAHADIAAAIHIADALVHALALGASGEMMIPRVEPEAWSLLGLTSPDLEPLVGEIERQFADVVQVLLLYEEAESPRG
ncbi:MAG TPA: HDOD domain-containing protein [Gemmatimonadales bacterium]|nr:HDOD domain-containing protein [Gemmatimonadales bacterium]